MHISIFNWIKIFKAACMPLCSETALAQYVDLKEECITTCEEGHDAPLVFKKEDYFFT